MPKIVGATAEAIRVAGAPDVSARPDARDAGALAIIAGTIHLAAAPAHFAEVVVYGAFFVLVGATQVAIGVALLRRPSRRLAILAVAVTLAVFLVYYVSRASGVPFGPHAYEPEPTGGLDAFSKLVELGLLAALVPLLSGRPARRLTRLVPAAFVLVGGGILVATTLRPGAGTLPSAAHSAQGASSRYSIRLLSDAASVSAGVATPLVFQIVDAQSRRPVEQFKELAGALVRVYVLSADLSYLGRLTPTSVGDGSFAAEVTLPNAGSYALYVEYVPAELAAPVTSTVALTAAGTAAGQAPRLQASPHSKVFVRVAGTYLVTLTFRGGSTPENSTGIEFLLKAERVRTPEPRDSAADDVAPGGYVVVASEDLKTVRYLPAEGPPGRPNEARFTLFGVPAPGRYKLFVRLDHRGEDIATEFTVELP